MKGKGIALADLVSITTFITERGLANIMTQNKTAMFPSRLVVLANGLNNASKRVPSVTAVTPWTCCRTEPGRVGEEASMMDDDLCLGRFLTNSKQ